jgi:hypothetical protein
MVQTILCHKGTNPHEENLLTNNNCLRHAMAETAARHCEGFPEAIQFFLKAAQSVGQSAISGLLRLRLAMTERRKSCQSFNPINPVQTIFSQRKFQVYRKFVAWIWLFFRHIHNTYTFLICVLFMRCLISSLSMSWFILQNS